MLVQIYRRETILNWRTWGPRRNYGVPSKAQVHNDVAVYFIGILNISLFQGIHEFSLRKGERSGKKLLWRTIKCRVFIQYSASADQIGCCHLMRRPYSAAPYSLHELLRIAQFCRSIHSHTSMKDGTCHLNVRGIFYRRYRVYVYIRRLDDRQQLV